MVVRGAEAVVVVAEGLKVAVANQKQVNTPDTCSVMTRFVISVS